MSAPFLSMAARRRRNWPMPAAASSRAAARSTAVGRSSITTARSSPTARRRWFLAPRNSTTTRAGVVTANTANIIINGAFNVANGGTFASVSSVGTFNGAVVNPCMDYRPDDQRVQQHLHRSVQRLHQRFGRRRVPLQEQFRQPEHAEHLLQHAEYHPRRQRRQWHQVHLRQRLRSRHHAHATILHRGTQAHRRLRRTPSPTASGVQLVSSFPAVTGFDNNFALDNLEIGNAGTNSILELSASADIGGASGDTNALFVNDLSLFGSSDLIIEQQHRAVLRQLEQLERQPTSPCWATARSISSNLERARQRPNPASYSWAVRSRHRLCRQPPREECEESRLNFPPTLRRPGQRYFLSGFQRASSRQSQRDAGHPATTGFSLCAKGVARPGRATQL